MSGSQAMKTRLSEIQAFQKRAWEIFKKHYDSPDIEKAVEEFSKINQWVFEERIIQAYMGELERRFYEIRTREQ